ncbi:hypothetical protein [Olleya sp. ITB9]|uniref:hypothetical protein n=1 Tax=Olleya sp. ITB9 TaxID=1715648 RepID=UPI0006CF35F7|nr:hypothetical protein [Olleya sp. ITB9]
MDLNSQIYQVKERLETLKNEYDNEVNKLIESPKCYIANNLKLTTIEEGCLETYPDPFLKSLAKTIKTSIDNNWNVDIDMDGEGIMAKGNPPKSVSYTVKHDWKNQVTSVGVTKSF